MYIIIHTYMSTPKSSRKSRSHRPSRYPQTASQRPKPSAPAPGTLSTRFSSAQLLTQFSKLLPAHLLMGWLASGPKAFYQRAFTPLITLWYFLFQRLQARHTLSKIVSDARFGGADCLSPANKPLSQQLHSTATTAASKARSRLPLAVLRQTLCHSAQEIRSWAKGLEWEGLNVGLLDGSTFRLRPLGDIAQVFPPHHPGNTKKQPYWCLVRVAAAFCLHSGVVLDCVLGDLKQSEQVLCAQLLAAGSWLKWIFVGDRNFGVYSVVRSATAASAQALVRLTAARARKLARQAGHTLRLGLDVPITWIPNPWPAACWWCESKSRAFAHRNFICLPPSPTASFTARSNWPNSTDNDGKSNCFCAMSKPRWIWSFWSANPPTWLAKNGWPA